MINPVNLRPFKHFCITIGNLPTSYVDSLSYYEMLEWLCHYLQDTVIPAVNTNAEAVTELQNLYVELKNYVDNYFENLDVQEEINNKLDEMVEDGVLLDIITPYIDTLTEAAQQATTAANAATTAANAATAAANQATDNVNNLTNQVGTIVDKLRNDLSKDYYYFTLPETMDSWFKNVQVLKAIDKNNYSYAIDIESLKNQGDNTIYVDCNNSQTGDGTESNPYQSLASAVTNASANDTLIVKKGIYYRQQLPNTVATQDWKSLNIICEPNTLFTTGQSLTWTTNATYTNVYQATRTNVQDCIDLRNNDRGLLTHLEKVSSIQACSEKIGSWYTDNSIVYVNLGVPVNDSNILCNLKLGYKAFYLDADYFQRNLHMYFENATFIGGYDGILKTSGSDTYTCEFIGNKCKFLFMPRVNLDGVSFTGTKSILIDCEASYNAKDGFNYHANENTKSYGIEINCIAQANGLVDRIEDHSYNGSTAHEGCQVIRIGGNYFDNNGGNVTDIDSDTITLNFNCNAFDSQAGTEDEFCTDFCCKYGTAKMYLYNCFSQGKSYRNIYANGSNTTINVDNCKYSTTDGTGTINIS